MPRSKITRFPRPADLNARRAITFEIPEFIIRAFECRVAEANQTASEDGKLELDHVIEHQLAQGITLADLAHLESQVPGLTAAVSRWISDIA